MASRATQSLLLPLLILLLAACGSAPPAGGGGSQLPQLHPAEMALDDLTGIWWSGAEDGGRVRMVGERRGSTVDVRMIGFASDGTQVHEHHTWTWDAKTGSYRIVFEIGGVERLLVGTLLPNGGIALEIPESAKIVHRNVFYSPAPDRLHIRQEMMGADGRVEEDTRVLVRVRPAISGALTSTKPDVAQAALATMGMVQEIRYADGRTALPAAAHGGLELTARLLRIYPEVLITVEGHDDTVGEADEAVSLSQARAADVAAFLGEAGVPVGQITVEPRGHELPMCIGGSADCQSRNRRVELRFAGLRELPE